MFTYELVITVWDGDLHKGKIRIVSNDAADLITKADDKLNDLEKAIAEENRRRAEIDDGIPF